MTTVAQTPVRLHPERARCNGIPREQGGACVGNGRCKYLRPKPSERPTCIHLGPATGIIRDCTGCQGKPKPVATRVCAVHGECTTDTNAQYRENGRTVALPWCMTCLDKTTADVPDLLPGLPDPLPVMDFANGTHTRPPVQVRHIVALHRLAGIDLPSPQRAEGSGVVIVGGGKYWPMAVIAVRMIRDVCDLPVQIWYRGQHEPVDPADLADLSGVTLHDTTAYPHRRMGGWEAKSIALLHCGFERVLYLDADAYPVSDPRPFLDLATPERPFAFWQDQANHDSGVKWELTGIDKPRGQRVPCVQGGQLAIHRAAFWRTLVVAHWLNQHSEYFYSAGYGDQDQWRIALAVTGSAYHCLGRAPWRHPAFVCPINGKPVIVHRCQSKWWAGDGDKRANNLPEEARAWAHRERFRAGPGGDAADVFGRIYRLGLWGHGDKSGGGSTPAEAAPYLELVNGLARVADWQSVVDLACGDGAITRRLAAPVVAGVDVFAPHLERLRREYTAATWYALDLDTDRAGLPSGAVALLKDVLHHWPSALIREWLAWAKASRKWRWLVLTYDCANARPGDCQLGGYRPLSVDLAPLAGLGLRRLTRYLHKEVALLECSP